MTLPNFFVVGTAKSGTTSLARYLESHPDVCFCQSDEPNFFAFDHEYRNGLDFYKSYYDHYNGEKVIGEKSWRYSCLGVYPKALRRILDVIPTFKVIYLTRDPLSRAISMWRELRDSGQDRVHKDPNTALRSDTIILDSMRYMSQFNAFRNAVGAKNVRSLFFEDFKSDPDKFYHDLCSFLEIDVLLPEANIHANLSVHQRSDTAILEAARRLGLDKSLRALTPETVRSHARKLLKRPIHTVDISPETRAIFLRAVRDECDQYLRETGKPATFWNLEP